MARIRIVRLVRICSNATITQLDMRRCDYWYRFYLKAKEYDRTQAQIIMLVKRIEQSEALIRWLDKRIEGQTIPTKERAQIVASCLSVALEHHKSIVLTASVSYHSSAFALVRLEFEAYIRGAWFRYYASDEQLDIFKNNRLKKRVGNMITDLETKEAFKVGVLSKMKEESWDAMNSFTHTGLLQVVRQMSSTEIGSNFPEEEIVGALDTADTVALLSAMVIVDIITADVTVREALAHELLDRMILFAGTE